MGPVSATTVVDAPRQRVFDVIADLSQRPSYTDHFLSQFRLQRLEPRGVGAAARFLVGAPLNRTWMETVIAEAVRPHRIVERGSGGRANRVPVRAGWELTEGPGAMTTVRLAFATDPDHPADRLRELIGMAAPWYARQWRRALRRLGPVIEGERKPIERVRVAGGQRLPTGVA